MGELFATIAERGRALLDLDVSQQRESEDIRQLAEALVSSGGEASGTALAKTLLDSYEAMDNSGKINFLQVLVTDFGTDMDQLDAAIDAYHQDHTELATIELHYAAEPRRQELIRRLNLAPGGTKTLVSMRAFLLSQLQVHPRLKPLERDFHHLLLSWFNRGFLVMQRIDWNTPAVILEKIIRYEAVHAIHDWDDLRRRIDPPDRRCYAFFHPALIDDPLVFVEVAFTRDLPDAINPVLTKTRDMLTPDQVNTAVFYSISNCQAGLRGVSFGNFLIKQVVEDLRRDLPQIENFVTLSPVPEFMHWLLSEVDADDCFSDNEKKAIDVLRKPGWQNDRKKTEEIRKILLPIAAHYFIQAKSKGFPYDSVARFHLGNGARLERINWLADCSDSGMKKSAGLMVNYLYIISDIEKNHEAFASRSEVVVAPNVLKQFKSRRAKKVF